MELSQDEIVILLGILLGVSELVALNPKMKSNSVLQLVINSLKRGLGKKEKEPEKSVEDIAREEAIEAIIDEIEKHK